MSSFGQAVEATPDKRAGKKGVYAQLLAKLKNGDTSIDFKELRLSSVESDDADTGEADRDLRRKLFEAYDAKNYKDAIKAGEAALKSGYLDIETHLVMALANREAADVKKFEFHKAVYLGLLNSILASGDGKSAKTAFVVINVGEEYAVLNALELKRGSQSLQNVDGHKYDVLNVTDTKTNERKDVFFNIDIVWAGYDKIFKD